MFSGFVISCLVAFRCLRYIIKAIAPAASSVIRYSGIVVWYKLADEIPLTSTGFSIDMCCSMASRLLKLMESIFRMVLVSCCLVSNGADIIFRGWPRSLLFILTIVNCGDFIEQCCGIVAT